MTTSSYESEQVLHVFVYGTLKRGQIREGMWPQPPIEIRSATTQGELFDLGSYPAMTPGNDRVAGEVWRFEPAQMPETLRVLDEIEDYRDASDDLYKRLVVECDVNGETVRAYTYHYASTLDASFRVTAKNGGCEWPSTN